ncbi:MAG TPA: extracellular solute-binding protein, partial [Candidatus Acidoferrum sp.]|nr:extracellular solute-binding protein [Candidatus Acidoferrum sp.]
MRQQSGTGYTRRAVLKYGLAGVGALAVARFGRAHAQAKTLTVWNLISQNKEADEAVEAIFKEWSGKNGLSLDFQNIPPTEINQRITVAVEAKSPPDVFHVFEGDIQFYRAQGLLVDVTDVINEAKAYEGGWFESCLLAAGYQGKYYGVPYAVTPWIMHTRDDLLKEAGVPYPKTWEDLIRLSPKISKPPQVYTYAMVLGDADDTNKNFMTLAWGYGGQLQNEQGALTFRSPGMLEAVKVIKAMYDQKVIPPGAITWDASGNNKAYQSRQAVFALNPNSIYVWLDQNDKDLLNKTGMYGTPAGPKGAYDFIDIRGFVVFKDGKNPAAGKESLRFFLQPANYEKVINASLNRTAPVFKRMMDRPLWNKPAYKEYKRIMVNGRIGAYAGPPNPAQGEVDTQWIVPHMLQAVCTGSK